MRSQDARDTALSAELAMISTRKHSWHTRFPLYRRLCQTPGLQLRRLAQAPLHLLGLDVLIHAEEIVGIVFLFDCDQPVVIAAVGFLHAFLSLVAHKEVYVRSARGIRMHGIVKIFRPRNNFF